MTLTLFDTFRREVVPFSSIDKDQAGVYSCGPTVYDRAHIGNLRTYIFVDLLRRVLEFNSIEVNHVMNITDVGHLVSDADSGEDKMEVGARRQNMSAWDIAKLYEAQFFEDTEALNILPPTIVCRATEHISEQIAFIQSLEKNGFTYKTTDGIYFDTARIDDYGHIARLQIDGLRPGVRVAVGEKKKLTDFALWKFSGDRLRQMEWDSPWGIGFPGWHIECSAMAEHYLGSLFDIHVGGEDHIPVHHTNEIAQSQGKNGTRMANVWMHGYFLQIDNEKVAKSGRSLLLSELTDRGYDPLSYRYLTLTAHYRSRLNFTWESLSAANIALSRLRKTLQDYEEGGDPDLSFQERFLKAVNRDLDMPKALTVLWELVKSQLPGATKKATAQFFDRVLGLQLDRVNSITATVPDAINELAQRRLTARAHQDWPLSDQLRDQLAELGYRIEDHADGFQLTPFDAHVTSTIGD